MHTNTHELGTQYQCDICQKTFKNLNDARTHSHKACGNITQKECVIDIEDVEDNNRCNACSTSYTSNTELEKHTEKHHAANCSTCLTTFKSQEDVYKHANKCHEIQEGPLTGEDSKCGQCSYQNKNIVLLEEHKNKEHEEVQGGRGGHRQQQSRQKKVVEPSWTRATKQPVEEWLPRLKCQKCRYETNTQNELVHHIETKHKQANIKCDNCPKTFLNSESLVTHIGQKHTINQQQHSSNSSLIDSQINCVDWRCSFCGEKFQGKEVRDNHFCQEHPFRTVKRQGKTMRRNKIQEECKRGSECHHWKAGTCWFYHVKIVERPAEVQQPSRNTRRADMWCAYQDRCNRRQFCEFKHIDQEKDFIQRVLQRTGM